MGWRPEVAVRRDSAPLRESILRSDERHNVGQPHAGDFVDELLPGQQSPTEVLLGCRRVVEPTHVARGTGPPGACPV